MTVRRLLYVAVLLAGAGALVWAFLPKPVEVDLGVVVRGPMELTVDAEGRTRIRERYVVSAPVAGRLHRPAWREGDEVEAGRSVLARIDPQPASLLDERALRSAEARLAATTDAHARAEAELERARAAESLAATKLESARKLHAARTIPRQELDEAEAEGRMAASARRAAEFALGVAEHEEEMARIAVDCCRVDGEESAAGRSVEVRAPVGGVVLEVFLESATVVDVGTRLLEIGDARDLEVEVDLLSTDAVRVSPGARARLERWGGDRPLAARVRRVEPAGFTKVSALGIEEQRVWVILDLVDPPEAWSRLGDAYRVEARIVVWSSDDVVKVPAGALFRHRDGWAVYVPERGRARLRPVTLGALNALEGAVEGGLLPGDEVILHPSDRVSEDTRVRPRGG